MIKNLVVLVSGTLRTSLNNVIGVNSGCLENNADFRRASVDCATVDSLVVEWKYFSLMLGSGEACSTVRSANARSVRLVGLVVGSEQWVTSLLMS